MKSPIALAWTIAGASLAVAVMTTIGSGDEPHSRASSDGGRVSEVELAIEGLRTEVAQLRTAVATRRQSSAPASVEPGAHGASDAPRRGLATDAMDERSPAQQLAALAPAERKQVEELQSLVTKFFSGKATDAETKRFWKLAKSGRMLDMALAAAEADVEANPQSVVARMQLAEVNVAKLYALPAGAERRIWAQQAREQYTAVLSLDENNWEARNGLATGYFHSPKNLNLTADAIREFEKLRSVQEVRAVEGKQASVYVNLAVLYRRTGNEAKAQEVLRAGQVRHPQDKQIAKTLGMSQK